MKLIRRFMREEDGMGTVELVIIVAVLVGIALIFREAIFGFVDEIVTKIFDSNNDVNNLIKDPTGKP